MLLKWTTKLLKPSSLFHSIVLFDEIQTTTANRKSENRRYFGWKTEKQTLLEGKIDQSGFKGIIPVYKTLCVKSWNPHWSKWRTQANARWWVSVTCKDQLCCHAPYFLFSVFYTSLSVYDYSDTLLQDQFVVAGSVLYILFGILVRCKVVIFMSFRE